MDIIESVRQSLEQGPRIIEGLVAAAPTEALTWREADGAWNIVEVLCHVADGEITDWMPRVERILDGGGRFLPYDREGGFNRYRGWTAEALVGEFGWATIPATLLISYILFGIEEIGVEIENPFGVTTNDLPLQTICAGIETTLSEIRETSETGESSGVSPRIL